MLEALTGSRQKLRRRTRAFVREVNRGEACVFVDHGFQWDGANNVWLTRAQAMYVVAAGPVFDIRPRGFFSRVFGSKRDDNDRFFADFFATRTEQPAHASGALTHHARSLLAGRLDDARVLSDGRKVTLWRIADFGQQADSDVAATVVAEIVHYRADALAPLHSLAGSIYRPATGAWNARRPPAAEIVRPHRILIGPVVRAGESVMCARTPCGRASRRFVIDITADHAVSGALDALPPGAAHIVDAVGAARIECDGVQVALSWTKLNCRRSELSAGAELVSRVVDSHSLSPYR